MSREAGGVPSVSLFEFELPGLPKVWAPGYTVVSIPFFDKGFPVEYGVFHR